MLHLWIGKTYIYIICISYHISTTETCETNLRLYWNYIWNYISESNMWCIVYILDMNRYDIFAIFNIFGPWRELIETPSLRAVLQPRRCFWQHTPWKKQRQRCRISKVRNDLPIWQFLTWLVVGGNWRTFQITLQVQTQVHFAKTQQKSPKLIQMSIDASWSIKSY